MSRELSLDLYTCYPQSYPQKLWITLVEIAYFRVAEAFLVAVSVVLIVLHNRRCVRRAARVSTEEHEMLLNELRRAMKAMERRVEPPAPEPVQDDLEGLEPPPARPRGRPRKLPAAASTSKADLWARFRS